MIFEFSQIIKSKKVKIIFSNNKIDSIKNDKIEVSMHQTHSANVKIVSSQNHFNNDIDGMFTTNKDICLKIKTADCLPIFFYSESPILLGVVHAGWRGLKKGIIKNTFSVIEKNLKDISSIEVFIGPSISQKNYEVQNKFIKYFGSKFILEKNNKFFLDLKAVAKSQLNELGIKNVSDIDECTYENKLYHSYRRDKTSERLIGWIYYE